MKNKNENPAQEIHFYDYALCQPPKISPNQGGNPPHDQTQTPYITELAIGWSHADCLNLT